MNLLLTALLYLIFEVSGDDDSGWSIVDSPLVTVHPCNGSTDIRIIYEPGRSPEEENEYKVWIRKKFPKNTIIKMKFDKGATVNLSNSSVARIDLDKNDNDTFRIRFYKAHEGIYFYVQGCTFGVVSYIKSININTKEYCENPVMGFLDSYIEGYRQQAQSSCTKHEGGKNQQKSICGKRNSSIVQGESKRGDWPWHAALWKLRKTLIYVCGGTLISNYYVLTAAHCVVHLADSPLHHNLSVGLGKYNLFAEEFEQDFKEIEKITLHENFDSKTFHNDIALLKMKTEAIFNQYIQPACLWNDDVTQRITSNPIIGTIVGWGLDDNNRVASNLNQAEIPMIPTITCLRNNPSFYSFYLTSKKFCAGILNEAIACNGDSGGGFHVFVPDVGNDSSTTGSWYVRGIISAGVRDVDQNICNGNHYTVFTDVAKQREWILSHM